MLGHPLPALAGGCYPPGDADPACCCCCRLPSAVAAACCCGWLPSAAAAAAAACCSSMSRERLVNSPFFLALRGASWLRGSRCSVSGHRGRRSTHSPGAGTALAGGSSASPSCSLQHEQSHRPSLAALSKHMHPACPRESPEAAAHPPLHARPRHHHAVVGAEPRWRHHQLQPGPLCHRLQPLPHVLVAGHAARDH